MLILCFTAQGTSVVNYNIVNSNGVKIGARTSYICNVNQFASKGAGAASPAPEESWSKSEIRQMPAEVERLCACTDEITLQDIFVVKTHIGHGWRDVARRLLYSDGQIEQFEENYRFRGISEVSLTSYIWTMLIPSRMLIVLVSGNLSNISRLETS